MTNFEGLETAVSDVFDAVVARDDSDEGRSRIERCAQDLDRAFPHGRTVNKEFKIDHVDGGLSIVCMTISDSESKETCVIDLRVGSSDISVRMGSGNGSLAGFTVSCEEIAKEMYIDAVMMIARLIIKNQGPLH